MAHQQVSAELPRGCGWGRAGAGELPLPPISLAGRTWEAGADFHPAHRVLPRILLSCLRRH